jgi:2-polyprenyl-6-methoxyphenol hydroxylase-like FAD-dependent oxidoreductase
MKAAIIGGGVIGGGWAARFLLHGWDVVVSDPNPKVEKQIDEILVNAGQWLPALADVPMPPRGKLSFATSLTDAVADAVMPTGFRKVSPKISRSSTKSLPKFRLMRHNIPSLVRQRRASNPANCRTVRVRPTG